MLRWLCSVVPCGLVHCDVAPMASCHMALECWGVMLQCCHVAHGRVRCAAAVLPCDTERVRWTCQSLPRGMLVGPTCQVSMVVGPTWLRWTNGALTRGTEVAQWNADTCHTLSLLWFCVYMFGISSLHPHESLSPSCTQGCLDQILALDLSFLICFIFPEFILIAPLIQKLWNFHQKSLNSWWSSL
jgi:hypothetical protein